MQTVEQLQKQFGTYLSQHLFQQKPSTLYAPINYILEIGGKRIRPVLALLSCQLFTDRTDFALPAAMAVEVFHNFSLIHDDIMDEALTRRGKVTVHQKFGLNAGILSGDAMLIYAYEFLFKTPNSNNLSEMIRVLSKVAIKVCEGQQYDIDFEQRAEVFLEEYLQMIELKTAALLAGSLQLGALAANAPEKDQFNLYEFGRLTGIAFQLQDDLLDAFGDPEKFGKTVGGDIIQNKKTALYIKALELAPADIKTRLTTLFSSPQPNPQEKVAEVLAIFKQLKIAEFAKELRDQYQEKAFHHLEQVNAPDPQKLMLKELALSLLYREL